jgi:hypothetical protein
VKFEICLRKEMKTGAHSGAFFFKKKKKKFELLTWAAEK